MTDKCKKVALDNLERQFGYTNVSDLILKRAQVWDKYFGDISKKFEDEILNIDTCISEALDYYWGRLYKITRVFKEYYVEYEEMPVADASLEGLIAKYIGVTDETYTNGNFYKCVGVGDSGSIREIDNFNYLTDLTVNIDIFKNTFFSAFELEEKSGNYRFRYDRDGGFWYRRLPDMRLDYSHPISDMSSFGITFTYPDSYIRYPVEVEVTFIKNGLYEWQETEEPVNLVLDDDTFREMIKIRAFGSRWDGTLASMNTFLADLFKGKRFVFVSDSQSMSGGMKYEFSTLTPEELYLFTHYDILPRQAGVGLEIHIIDIDTTFGFYGTELQPWGQGVLYQGSVI
jgi:hypothetical protein